MNYQVKHLKLFEPLNFSVKTSSETDFSTEFEEQLISFVNKVPANSINPEKSNFLTEKKYLVDQWHLDNPLEIMRIIKVRFQHTLRYVFQHILLQIQKV